MDEMLQIEFEPKISQAIRESAKYLGLKAGDFVALCIENLLRNYMEKDPRYPVGEQLSMEYVDQRCKTLVERVRYVLELFVTWNKAKRGEPGYKLKDVSLSEVKAGASEEIVPPSETGFAITSQNKELCLCGSGVI